MERRQHVVRRAARSAPRLAVLAVLAVGTAGIAGCGIAPTVTGSGQVVEEARDIAAFTKVEAEFGIDLTIQAGSTATVKVRAQESILPILRTDVDGDTLRIRFAREYAASVTPHVTISTASLHGITLNGGVDATIDGIDNAAFAATLNGASTLLVRGRSDAVALIANGASVAQLDGLSAGSVALDLNGGSMATITASTQVSGQVAGGARATVDGGAEILVSTTGGGQVSRG